MGTLLFALCTSKITEYENIRAGYTYKDTLILLEVLVLIVEKNSPLTGPRLKHVNLSRKIAVDNGNVSMIRVMHR
jgi:hypothetical protein